jgi:hypothetical protein
MITWQFTALANELPQHTEHLKHKLADLCGMGHSGVIEKVQQTIEDVLSERHQASPARSGGLSGDEAADLVETYGQTHAPEDVYDDIVVPALTASKRDRDRGTITPKDLHFVLQETRAIIDGVELRQSQASTAATETPAPASEAPIARAGAKLRIVGCPARDEADTLALVMFQHLLEPQRYALEIVSPELLTAEVVALVAQQDVDLICIAALPPGTTTPTRYLCKRLRARFPACKIIVGR